MKFRVEEVQHNGRQVWRIVGPDNERVGEPYRSQVEAERECKKLNDMHADLEQALKANEIMEPLAVSDGKVCASIGQAVRIHLGRGRYTNVLLPPHCMAKLGDTLLVEGSVVTIKKSKKIER